MKNSRELINGARLLPQGYKLDERYSEFADASERVKTLTKQAKKQNTGITYNVSGFGGNYCILAYTDNKVIDRRYSHS